MDQYSRSIYDIDWHAFSTPLPVMHTQSSKNTNDMKATRQIMKAHFQVPNSGNAALDFVRFVSVAVGVGVALCGW